MVRADAAVVTAWTAYKAIIKDECELTSINAAGAASISISVEYGGTGVALTTLRVTPPAAVVTLDSTSKIIDVATKPKCCVPATDTTKCALVD